MVSVIITTFNRAGLVCHAIESVLAQTYTDVEVIVVDDGSTDGTESVVRGYGARVRYMRQGHAGQSSAQNHGMSVATGKYLAHLDSDDLWQPWHLEQCVQALEDDPEIGLVFTDHERFDEHGILMSSFFSAHPSIFGLPCRKVKGKVRVLDDGLWISLLRETYVMVGAVVMKTAVFRDVGGFDTRLAYSQDWEYWLRIARAFPVACICSPSLRVRHHSGNMSGNLAKQKRGEVDVLKLVRREYPGLEPAVAGIVRAEIAARSYDAGYQFFSHGDNKQARLMFQEGWKHGNRNARSVMYWIASCLPAGLVRRARRLKQRLGRGGAA